MLDFRKIKKKKKKGMRKKYVRLQKDLKKKKKKREWRNLFKRPHKIFLGLFQTNPKFFHMWTDFWT